ncbi:Vitamin D 25-hydroxylase, partial [Orchesella cincta]
HHISDPKLAKEIFSDINTTGRAQNAVTSYLANGYGIVAAQDQIWETQRRFTLRKLRDVGVLKSSIEEFIMKETATLTDFFKERVGKPIPGIKLYNGPVVNALWRTISGETIDWAALEKPAILKSVEYLVKLPYTEAIILETLRLSSIIPLGIPHQMLADTEFQGLFLPKGATVVTNAYGIHYDPKIWGDDVNKFRPERFLSNDKKHVIRHEALIPFSVGRRSCIGEGFARDVIFLFVASILQKFNLEPDPGLSDCRY